MIDIKYKKYIEGSSPPFYYEVLPDSCDCLNKVTNGTGSIAAEGYVEFTLSFNDLDCLDVDCTVTFQVTDSKGCVATQELVLVDPCEDFIVGPIAKLDDYVFTIPVTGGSPSYQYKWLYDQDIFTTLNDGNKTLTLTLKDVDFGYPEQTQLYVTVTDSKGCKSTVVYNISICQPIANNNSNYVRVACEFGQKTPLELSAIACSNRTIDWTTLDVVRVINNSTNQETTEETIKVYLVDTGGNSGSNRIVEIVRDSGALPGSYTFYWTVKDDLGIESEEGYILINVIPCAEPLVGDDPVIDECGCNITSCDVDENGELRTKLESCVVSECGCQAGFKGRGEIGDEGDCIDASTIEIVSGPYIPNAQAYYDPFTQELVYVPAVGSEGIDLVESIAYTHNGIPTGLIRWTIILTCYGPPEASDDVACVNCCETVNIDVLANDTPNFTGGFDLNSIKIISYPSYGTIDILPDGTIDYTALCNTGGQSEDSFQYVVKNIASDEYSNPATVTIEIACAGIDEEAVICINDGQPIAVVSANLNSSGQYSVNFKGYLSTGFPLDTNDEYEIEVWDVTNTLMLASATFFIDDDLTNIKPTTDNNWSTLISPYINNVTLTAGTMQSTGVTTVFNKEAFALAEGYANEYDDNGDIVGTDNSIKMKFVVRCTNLAQPATSADSEDDMERIRLLAIEDTNYVDQMANPDGNLASTWSWVGTPGLDSTFTTSISDLHASQEAYTWFSQSLNLYNKPPGKLVQYKFAGDVAQTASVNYTNEASLINAINNLPGGSYFSARNWAFYEPNYNLFGNNALIFTSYVEYPDDYLEQFDIMYLNGTANNGKRTNCIIKNYILY